jgi:hypothetical protein
MHHFKYEFVSQGDAEFHVEKRQSVRSQQSHCRLRADAQTAESKQTMSCLVSQSDKIGMIMSSGSETLPLIHMEM